MGLISHTNINYGNTNANPVFKLLQKIVGYKPTDIDILLALATLEKPPPPIEDDDTDILLALATLEEPEDDTDILLALAILNVTAFGNITKKNNITGEVIAFDWNEKTKEIVTTTIIPGLIPPPSIPL